MKPLSKDDQGFWDACAASAAGTTLEEVDRGITDGGGTRIKKTLMSAKEIAELADELVEERRKRNGANLPPARGMVK